MPRFKDSAVCVRLIDWSETSQVVALFTRCHGMVRGLAKGAKRMSPGAVHRFSGGIELLNLGEVVAATKQTEALATITEWDLQDGFWHLRRNLRAHRLGMYVADLAHAMLAVDDPHPASFDAVTDALRDLAGDPAQQDLAMLTFQWRLLDDCGYRPELTLDARTGEPLADARHYSFDASAGGLVADAGIHTNEAQRGPWRVRAETVALLRRLASDEPITPSNVVVPRASRLLCVYLRALLDRPLPTMRFILA